MGIHAARLGRRSVTGIFTGIQKVGEPAGQGLGNAGGLQPLRDVVPVEVFHLHAELVGDEAQQGTVQFLIEGSLQALVQEVLGQFEPFHGHLGRRAVAGSRHVGTQGGPAAQGGPDRGSGCDQEDQQDPIGGASYQESGGRAEGRFGGPDEPDVFAQVPDALPVDGRQGLGDDAGGAVILSPGHMDLDRFGGQGHIAAGIDIIIGIFNRRDREIAVAARDERILERLASRGSAGRPVGILGCLDVVYFKIGGELDLRSLQQGDIALSGNGDQQRGCIVGFQRILAQPGGHRKRTHATAVGGRCTGRQAADRYGGGRSRHALADLADIVLKEAVKDAVGAALDPDVDQAYQFRRIDLQGAGLLGNQHPAAQDGAVVDFIAEHFPVETDVGRGLHLLAPEAVEGRETGIFESGDVHPLVEFQRSGDRLADDDVVAAEGQAHEQVIVGDIARRLPGLGIPLPGRLRSAAGSPARTGDDLNGHCPGTDGRPADGRGGGRKGELARALRRQDIRIGKLGRFAPLPVYDADAGGRAGLRSPDQLEIIPGAPGEIRRTTVPFEDKGDAELFVEGDDVLYFHADRRLGPQGHGRRQSKQYNR